MQCVVPGANVKILAKAIHTLAKVGDEMYVQPQQNSLSFRTVNVPNSAYADFTFLKSFFSYYVPGDLQEDDALKCKISMRSAMTVFKAPNTIDKQVETCHIKLQPRATTLLVILKHKNSITKSYILPIIDCEKIQASYNKDDVPNQLTFQPRVFGEAVYNFQQNLVEITLEVTSQKVLLRNYVDDLSSISNITRTQLAFGTGEFDRYVVGTDCTITFCMKELKAILLFAEMVALPISMYFEVAGRPVVFVLKNQTYEVNLVLSTLNPDEENPSNSITSRQEKSVRRRTTNKTPTRASKSTNKKQSLKSTQSTNKSLFKDKHPCFIKDNNHKQSKTLNKAPLEVENNEPVASDNASVSENTESTETDVISSVSNGKSSENGVRNDVLSLLSSNASPRTSSRSSKSSRKLVNSVFANITKRKSNSDCSNGLQSGKNPTPPVLDETVMSSQPPPSKRARTVFKKCFQATFDPRMLPGHDDILAEDSDECISD